MEFINQTMLFLADYADILEVVVYSVLLLPTVIVAGIAAKEIL